MKTARTALFAACLAVAAGPVFASAYSTATIGNVTITLIDLDPNDGVAASIVFVPETTKFTAGAYISGVAQTGQKGGEEAGNEYNSFLKTGAWSSTNVSATAYNNLATTSASVTGSATGVGFTAASLSGTALSSATQGAYVFSEAKMQASPTREKAFILSANTEVVFSYNVSLSASTTIGALADGTGGESAMAQVMLYAGGPTADGGSWLPDVQEHHAAVDYADGSAPFGGADSWSGVMSTSYSNLSNQSSQGEVGAYAVIRGVSVMTAVPEPSTYGMLLGGLGVMGGLVRRRRGGRVLAPALAAACLAVSAGPALASASSSATIGNLVITLTSLNPTDGTTPWISFTNPSAPNVVSQSDGYGDTSDHPVSIRYAPASGGLVTTATHTDWSKSSASVLTADSIGGYAALSAHGQADSGLDGYGGYWANAAGASSPYAAFTLSANTKVTFSVVADLKAQTSMGYNLDADMAEFAHAKAVLNIWGEVYGIYQTDTEERNAWATFDVRDDNTTMGVSDSWSGDISATFYNYGATAITGGLQTYATAEGESALWDGVTPVPEPASYAMMLGGLALVGAIRRRSSKVV